MKYFHCGCFNDNDINWFGIYGLKNNHGIMKRINKMFDGIKSSDLINSDPSITEEYIFNPIQIVVLKMED